MRLPYQLIFGAILSVVSQTACAAETKHKLSDISIVPITNGINQIDDFDRKGTPAIVVSACRETGTAGSYDRFMILLKGQYPDDKARWDVVTVDTKNNKVGSGGIVDTVRNDPHTVEDQVASVVLAKANLDGQPATILIEGWRDISPADGIPAETPVVFEIYKFEREDLSAVFNRVEVVKSVKKI
ncbi:MAG: hypothetical protein EPO08_01260 [Rhodospirillaceae bacterium]|nr:MAG: hypothetical protein EPO08_01260 [Rhodospirillaceae bacterium]